MLNKIFSEALISIAFIAGSVIFFLNDLHPQGWTFFASAVILSIMIFGEEKVDKDVQERHASKLDNVHRIQD